MNNTKAQSTIEFFSLVIFLFFFFLALTFGVHANISQKNKQRVNLEIIDLASSVKDEIDLAASSTEGYQREFILPTKIAGRDYEINITENTVYVRTSDGKFATALPVLKITGDVIKGQNKISKSNDSIILN